MKPHRMKFLWLLALMAAFVLTLSAIGCGGGGSDTSQTDGGGQGTVAVYLTDGPSDAFDHIWLSICEITLIPSADGAPQVIFQSDDPQPIDLLALRDGDTQLIGVGQQIEANTYSGIRLEVDSIEGQTEGRTIRFNLSSRTIELRPQQAIVVDEGQPIAIQLDIDADKSIQITGSEYSFRPVVFVDADPMRGPIAARQVQKGEIEALIYDEAQPELVAGFQLSLFHGIHTIDVMLDPEAVIFDELGDRVGPQALEVGQMVYLTGELDDDGQFWADRVVIGPIDIVAGLVETAVESDQFQLDPFFLFTDTDDENITVALLEDTILFIDGVAASPDQIQPGQKACVAGKLDEETGVIQAIALYLRAARIVGTLTDLTPVDGGSQLTISRGPEEIIILMPSDIMPTVKGGHPLTVQELSDLIACEPPQVQVTIDRLPTDETVAQAITVEVLPQIMAVTVAQVDTVNRIITTAAEQTISVPEDAVLLVHNGLEQEELTLADLNQGDLLWVAALATCEPADYQATVVIKVAPLELPCMPHLERIEMTVAQIGDDTLADEEGTVVAITEDTLFIDHTQPIPQEMAFEDIEVGDTLVCEVLSPCEEAEAIQALIVIRVDPEDAGGEDPPGPCMPEASLIDVTVGSIFEGSIVTTEGVSIQVPEGTPIVMATEEGVVELALSDIQTGDQLNLFVVRNCTDDSLTAVWILKIESVEG